MVKFQKSTKEDKTEQARIPNVTKDEYEVIGWIEPVKNVDGVENTKVVRVKIYTGETGKDGFPIALSGIVLMSSIERFMNKEIASVPIKTKTQE